MNIKEMHYDFKKKLNKTDSQQWRNLLVPEIDWALNEAQELFIKMVAQPRLRSYMGFEKTQRSIDDIRTLVVDANIDVIDNALNLPQDYWHYLRGRAKMSKGTCSAIGTLHIRQHDDEFEQSPFDNSSFDWREVNGLFKGDTIRLIKDDSFKVNSIDISYIRKPIYMHNAQDFRGGKYKLPNGEILGENEPIRNCELPEHTHREIVDIAVLLVTGEIGIPDYQIKLNKINFNNLKQ